MVFHALLSVGGMTLCGLVIFQLACVVARGVQESLYRKQQFRLSTKLLRAKITSAKRSLIFPSGETHAWEGLRKFRIKWKVQESNDCHSFYLVPHDGKPLPPFRPGQYLTLSGKLPSDVKPTIRCYSLSDAPRQDFYRISVKKMTGRDNGPPGKFSAYLNDVAQEGDIIDVKAPRGSFYLDTDSNRPVVFLAGGVGITPVMSMLNYLVQSGMSRDIHFYFAVRNSKEHPFKKHLAGVVAKYPNVFLHTVYSRPLASDREGFDYNHQGRLNISVLQDSLPSNNFDFYLCGPPAFMKSLTVDLKSWGVPNEHIKMEAFGPASVRSAPKPKKTTNVVRKSVVEFARAAKELEWDSSYETLLDLANAHQISIESGCRAGNCGTCVTALKSGMVQYNAKPGCHVEDGTCLPCIGIPEGTIVLDA